MKIREDILQTIYEIIGQTPSIITPYVCLELFKSDIDDPGLLENELATWLNVHHQSAWEITCAHVDHLVEVGDIIFTDDGNLYQIGYEGAIV
tara:strand:- start:8808 stop:9083 length:276 start_codon:yes stop_codon:yes gene_type:complete